MTEKKIGNGVRRTGHLVDAACAEIEGAVHVEFDERGAIVTWSRVIDDHARFIEAFHNAGSVEVPPILQFVDHQGHLTLAECREVGSSLSLNGVGSQRIRALLVVHSGGPAFAYDDVNIMQSEVDGLAEWSGVTSVTRTLQFEEGKGLTGATVKAASVPDVVLGGELQATLTAGFSIPGKSSGNVHTVTDILHLRTESPKPIGWREHQVRHRMMQDLMYLVYGRPCRMTAKWVAHEDDHFAGREEGSVQRKIYVPSFGQGSADVDLLDRDKHRPLFRHAVVDPSALERWRDDFDHWSRPTWIAVGMLFQSGMTIEVLVLQIGVALEALGYAIWDRAGRPKPVKGDAPNYLAHLESIVAEVAIEHELCSAPTDLQDGPKRSTRSLREQSTRTIRCRTRSQRNGVSTRQCCSSGVGWRSASELTVGRCCSASVRSEELGSYDA